MLKNSDRLQGVHPKLIEVIEKAMELEPELEFMVIEGVRSDDKCYTNWGKGRTAEQCKAAKVPEKYAKPKEAKVTWLKNPLSSKHRKHKDGFSHAVDLEGNVLHPLRRVGVTPHGWRGGQFKECQHVAVACV